MVEARQHLEIEGLRAYWERQTQRAPDAHGETWVQEQTMLCGLRLNILETLRFLAQSPTFDAFEDWIVERNGGYVEEASLNRLRRAFAGETVGPEVPLDGVEGLSEADLAHWDEHGYVVLKNAVSAQAAEAAELAIYQHLQMDRDAPESWYGGTLGKSIWVPLLRHPALEANRRSPRMVKAFSQLWGRDDLWTTIDQGGLNPPEREGWQFPGPHLHWDTTLAQPHHFDVGGILYLVDVAEDQGAFSCVPGFHKSLQPWLDALPTGVDPRDRARETLTMKPVAARRGDMVIWHQSLPHGSSPNHALRPRVAQYIAMRPTQFAHNTEWR